MGNAHNINIGKNFTRYATEDLQAILDLVLERPFKRPNGQMIPFQHVRTGTTLSVEPLYKTEAFHRAVANAKHYNQRPPSPYTKCGDPTLRIAPPRDAWADFPLEGLADSSVLPSSVVEHIFDALLERFVGIWALKQLLNQSGNPAISYVERKKKLKPLQVRILDSSPDKKPPSKKLTADEKMRKLLTRYGPGGQLVGVDYDRQQRGSRGYNRSGTRSDASQWKHPISSAQGYYEREKKFREKIGEKIRQQGGSVPPYETWPEYLRRLADEIEGVK